MVYGREGGTRRKRDYSKQIEVMPGAVACQQEVASRVKLHCHDGLGGKGLTLPKSVSVLAQPTHLVVRNEVSYDALDSVGE